MSAQYDTLSEKEIHGEKEVCKIVLLDISEQNNDCKKKLSDLVSAIFSPNLLEQAEIFLSRFLNIDNTISILQNELAQLDGFLHVAKSLYVKLFHELHSKITIAEKTFNELKTQFSDYLMGIA